MSCAKRIKSQLCEFLVLLEKTKCEINLVLKNVEKISLVLINKFTSLQFSISNIRKNKLDELASKLNQHLEENIPTNVKLVDIEKLIASIGISNSLDWRYYYSSKALYTVEFFKALITSRLKKCLNRLQTCFVLII